MRTTSSRFYSFVCALLLIVCAAFVHCIPIDNGVEGEPEIECGATAITVSFNTRNNFEGHVYVIGRYGEAGCRSDEGGRRVAGIKLGFDKCGTQRQRSLNPKGIFVTSTVVITFHPQFLTKVDRAYRVQCFYMEADKTVSQDLEVSEITTVFQTQTVPMPVCTYSILEGGPNGQPIKFANIGQQVYHKWSCATETTDIFCAVVHSCFVDDGAGNRVQLLDQNGCALDRYLLQNLEYASDLMAGQEAHVFKYADKPALFFQCQISITVKEPSEQCPRPQCAAPGGAGGGGAAAQPGVVETASVRPPPVGNRTSVRLASPPVVSSNSTNRTSHRRNFDFPFRFRRFRRDSLSSYDDQGEELGVWDVQSQMITALDVGEEETNGEKRRSPQATSPLIAGDRSGAVCFSPGLLFTIACIAITCTVLVTATLLIVFNRKCRNIRRK